MRTMKKRIVAILCVAALVFGLCMVDGKPVAKANGETQEATPESVEYQAATPGVAPTENIPEGYIFAGWYTNKECTEALEKEIIEADKTTVYAKIVPEGVLGVKAQYLTNDGMIADCEDTANATVTCDQLNTLTVTSEVNEFKEGSHAYKTVGTEKKRAEIILKESVDISAYKKGGLHFWIYTPDYNKLGGTFTITLKDSTGHSLQWKVYETRFMSEDWVQVKLYFNRATILPSAEGSTFDYKHVNYFEITNNKNASTGYTTIIDDIRAVAALPGMTILDCDDKDNAENSATLAPNGVRREAASEYVKDGYGAYYSKTSSAERFIITFPEEVDLSKEKENSSLHFWLYIKNTKEWQDCKEADKNFRVELFTMNDDNTAQYKVLGMTLPKAGWNEITLKLSDIATKIDLTKIKGIRLRTAFQDALELAIDDVRVIQSTLDEKTILDCEDTENVTLHSTGGTINLELTNLPNFVKVGKGAYRSKNSNVERFQITFHKTMDLSSYAEKGSLHFWLYISENASGSLEKWKDSKAGLRVQMRAQGDSEAKLFDTISPENLEYGWNEITIELSKGKNKLDMSKIDMIRMHTNGFNGYLDMAVDDFRIVEEIPEEEYISQSASIRFVTTVDSLDYQKVGFDIAVNGRTVSKETETVYRKLIGIDANGNSQEMSPDTEFSEKSRYFATYPIYNIPRSAFSDTITVTPYWETLDGTKVSGTSKEYRVRDLINSSGN